jgi:cob(I)alamin adenosyltransferase
LGGVSIVTRHGDGGETSLLYGGRVPKDDLHTEAYGALDEAISALGLARSLCAGSDRAARILELQRDLFTVGAELATAAADRAKLQKHFATVSPAMVDALDAQVAALEAVVALPKGFVIPGGDPVAAAIDLGRTFVRRAERRAVTLRRAGGLANDEVLRYLNRCSDLLFMLAREAEGASLVAK